MKDWPEGEIRWIALESLGERYRRYRLPDAAAEAAMTGSMARSGQLSPLAVCLREETPEGLDGFKRLAAARALPGVSSLQARLWEVDEQAAKAMMLAVNGTGRGMKALEEAWIVHALVREDGLSQVQVAELLELDAALADAEKQRWGPLELLSHVLGPQADLRQQRAIDRRIREARFREPTSLEGFDWALNSQSIDRLQIETLATGEFIRRGDNLVIAGQSGVGKSRIVQSVGRAPCAHGYRVRYTTSAELLRDLTASLADHSLPQRLRYYSNFDLLAIDEFGFDRIERAECGQPPVQGGR